MTDDLPQREPGATLPTHFERVSQALDTISVSRGEPDGPLARSFSCDEATMRRVAEYLPQWTGDPAAD